MVSLRGTQVVQRGYSLASFNSARFIGDVMDIENVCSCTKPGSQLV